MRGDIVIVRCHGGWHRICIVWASNGPAVAVCSENVFQRLLAGDNKVRPVEVLASDVFQFDENWPPEHGTNSQVPDWSLLKPWTARGIPLNEADLQEGQGAS